MAFRPKEQAEAELAEHFPIFREAIATASNAFWRRLDVHVFDPGTRVRMIRDYVVHELRRLMDGKRDTHIENANQTTLFAISQNWIVQVHKVDEGNEIAKNFTQISMDLRDNKITAEVQEMLPGLPAKATVLFLGYVINEADPKSPEMRLCCPGIGEQQTWMIPLGIAAPPPAADITPQAPPPEPGEGTKVVVPNKAVERKLKQ